MKIDLFLSTALHPGHSYEHVFDDALLYVSAAEEMGYHAVWVNEHHFVRFGSCSAPLAMAGFLLGRTRRIRVGTAVVLLPLHNPVEVAEQAAILDQLSGGRLDLGVGRGAYPLDWTVFDMDVRYSNAAVREHLDTILRAWTQDTVSASTPWLSFPDAHITPRPRTTPCPPVFLATASPGGVEHAAKLGIPLLISWHTAPAEKKQYIDIYERVAKEHGQNPHPEHVITGIAHVGGTRDAAKDEITPHLGWWMEEGERPSRELERLREDPRAAAYEEVYSDAAKRQSAYPPEVMAKRLVSVNPIGTADQVADWMAEASAVVGSQRFAFFMDLTGDRERTLEVMKAVASSAAEAPQYETTSHIS